MEKLIEDAGPAKWDGYNSKTVIKVIGVGGAGGNAVNTMIKRMTETEVEFIAANTDQQALSQSKAPIKIPLGSTGLGAGSHPEVGQQAANEVRDQIAEKLRGATMLFITAGMGGGTGTGASPVIAEVAQELGILTVAVVTKPFFFEGSHRMRVAEKGLQQLKNRVHSLIVILNDKLEDLLGEAATVEECFEKADEVLYNACSGIAELIERVGRVNLDFNDVRTVMAERGTAMMGSGEAEGPDRALNAASQAIFCPLLEGAKLKGARGLLVNVTAARSMRMAEYRTALETVKNYADKEAVVIAGTVYDDSMGDRLRVTVIATGLDQEGTDDTFVKPMPTEPDLDTAENGSQLWNPSGTSGPFSSVTQTKEKSGNDLFSSPFLETKKQESRDNQPISSEESKSVIRNEVNSVHNAEATRPEAIAPRVTSEKPSAAVQQPNSRPQAPVDPFSQFAGRRISTPDAQVPTPNAPSDSTIFGRENIRPASDVFATLNPQHDKNSGLWTTFQQGNASGTKAHQTEPKPADSPNEPRFDYGIPTFLRKKN